MRQAEAPPSGKWTGPVHAGVKAPDPILMPDPATRFAATARRLERLAAGHPMEAWLRFMAKLSMAQHEVATTLAPAAVLDASAVTRTVEARLPPLAADGHRRESSWREGLALLLDRLDTRELPPAALDVIAQLHRADEAMLEKLADRFLRGGLSSAEAGAAVYVAAALQVYFTDSAARLKADDLRLLEERGLCPCCGSPPVSGLITASGSTPGNRYLYCSLCSTAWNHVRAVCITCGGTRHLSLQGIEGDPGLVQAETCGDCHTYAKLLYQIRDMQTDPYADDLASLGLDMLVGEAGFARHAPNPLLLVGEDDATEA
ncbi:formate dehydrogenase accessory protein FdhE [Dyella sp. BiH032]|uniref:formate dehydrogenase accessory protein FdhE n=1 Tax=Dyella sp. BiH032 TaxID=3075430 RepID=UPI002892FA1D|nr:formate dehydrogenase accessory protein FdhE [Dyella sp. BiH032]WNL44204.1 formate dehydrogenase accessory protein FdhE [Dyella sp. BiH032]